MQNRKPIMQEPPFPLDPVIKAYKIDVDRTLLRENLKSTTSQRPENFVSFYYSVGELRQQAIKSMKKVRS